MATSTKAVQTEIEKMKHDMTLLSELVQVTSPIEEDLKEIYSYEKADGKKIQIFVSKEGNLIGKTIEQGVSRDAKLIGLPKSIPPIAIPEFKKFLQGEAYCTSVFDTITVNPRGRGGSDFWMGAAAYSLLHNWLYPQHVTNVTGTNSSPPIVGSNATVNANINYGSNPSTQRGPSAGLLISAGAVASAGFLAYGTYLYKRNNLVTKKDPDGNTALHKAVLEGNIETVKNLLNDKTALSSMRPKADVNAKNNEGNTPLHLAISQAKPKAELIQILIDLDANGFIENEKGETAIDLAHRKKDELSPSVHELINKLKAHRKR